MITSLDFVHTNSDLISYIIIVTLDVLLASQLLPPPQKQVEAAGVHVVMLVLLLYLGTAQAQKNTHIWN